MKRKLLALLIAACGGLAVYCAVAAVQKTPQQVRESAKKAFDAGNFKDAYDGYSVLALDPHDDAQLVSDDLGLAVQALQRLARADEIDDFRERVVTAHQDNWRLLWRAAETFRTTESYGFIVAGKFYRGPRHGNDGRLVNAAERDRIRSLQLMRQAMKIVSGPKDRLEDVDDVANFYFAFAEFLLDNRMGNGAWQLQFLSDLSKLPDYDEWRGYSSGESRGAPVDEAGAPIYHHLPASWDTAKSDGARWRWCLAEAARVMPAAAPRANFTFAQFLQNQFDVQTMAEAGYSFFGRGGAAEEDTRKNESGPYAVSSLSEKETIARLASGIKRFTLPDEFNFIRLLQQVADQDNRMYGEQALNLLAELFENRQQYDRAVEFWKQSIARYGPGDNAWKQLRVDQVLGNWGVFETTRTQPAGTDATFSFLFRNGKKVHFDAWELNERKLLEDVKAFIKSKPKQLDWEQMGIDNIGWRIVEKNQNQYRGKQAASWDLDVTPREKHFDRRIMVKTPLKKGGAYLLTATMQGGNTNSIALWVADTVLVKKTLSDGAYCFVADAVTGQPVPSSKLSFFGWQQKWLGDRNYEVNTREMEKDADADGQAIVATHNDDSQFQWMITATAPDGRFAYYGFTGIWGGQYAYDAQYNQRKDFVITDRPVYRPGQPVKLKFWVGQAQYDQKGPSPFANKPFNVEIRNPKNEKVFEKSFTADAFGGFDGEFPVDTGATLGAYTIRLSDGGGGSFRVEEYKKPEFEVKVDAPAEPVSLGEKVTATISAKYYFGAPVTQAKVKYKVLRSSYSAQWYPPGRWDWFYGPGYWWFAQDYNWYPGWDKWGCLRPRAWWFGASYERPEVVSENEVPIGPDGTVKVEIDTALAKAIHGDTDHKYDITAEMTDDSRRTIVGQGTVMVARRPFKVYAWVDRGYYQTGDVIHADLSARTLDNKPVKGKGTLRLLQVTYKDLKPVETEVQKWDVDTDDEGTAQQQLKADKPGQYRLSYTVTDSKGHEIEGGYVFVIRGPGFDGRQFRFNDIELTLDKKEYKPGDKVRLMINAERENATVVLFLRPTNGIYLPPKVMHLDGKSIVEEIAVTTKEMPNFFVEAFTISDARVFEEMRECVVPPEDRVINVQVMPSAERYKPGQKAVVKFKLTDANGQPVVGSAVVSIYDKSVEYISGGSNVPEIKSFFWKWRRSHYPRTEASTSRCGTPLVHSGQVGMQFLGVFGHMVGDVNGPAGPLQRGFMEQESLSSNGITRFGGMRLRSELAAAPAAVDALYKRGDLASDKAPAGSQPMEPGADQPAGAEPVVRKNFADTALWVANLTTDESGIAEVELTMPESLTAWKAKVWSMSAGTRCGQGEAEVTTYKDLIVRLQAPRFFVQKDEVVLSANVHNYLKDKKRVRVTLELDGPTLGPVVWAYRDMPPAPDANAKYSLDQVVEIDPNSEKRVDWSVRVFHPGTAVVRMKAVADAESDAMQMTFPVYVHGMLKTDSYSGAMRPQDKTAALTFNIPQERRPDESRVEVRYSPSVASAMVDALPYLVDYPYGCTEQTLNRFLPTVVTQKVLISMGINLKDVEQKRTNLNAQEIGDDAQRAADWKRNSPPNPGVAERNPVFDEATVHAMTREGVQKLANMQLSDGGWGWFSGFGEQSWPHTTAVVVHGLQIARQNDVALPPGMLDRGVEWLKRYQAEQVRLIRNALTHTQPWKPRADDIDAFVFMVLADAGVHDAEMDGFLYRDRIDLAVVSKAMYALALHTLHEQDKLDMLRQNLSQFVVQDEENQTAYLRMPEGNPWWNWYGSDVEAMGYYLQLLARTDAKGPAASRLAKYLINNRKHASYWNSTRDTAVCVEALAEYIKASGESNPDVTISISLDGRKLKDVQINATNLFTYDNRLVLSGAEVTTGAHRVEFTKAGTGPLYFNAYVTNFTLEDPIRRAGLEVKVSRKFYKLVEADKTVKAAGSRGQAVDQKVEKYDRVELADRASLKSGDLVEVELEIDSKNDYEYVIFEDMKASGFELVEVRSGYNGNDLNAYMELHDERVCFFARTLSRGKHSVAYRVRAEVPGKFSALPTKASAMYAPELRANSDEMKLTIVD